MQEGERRVYVVTRAQVAKFSACPYAGDNVRDARVVPFVVTRFVGLQVVDSKSDR